MKPSEKQKNRPLVLRMCRLEALARGLLTCTCGHPINNHFDHGKNPCAHCACQEYIETPRFSGRIGQ